MKRIIEVIECDWCYKDTEIAMQFSSGKATYDVCPTCADEIVMRMTRSSPPPEPKKTEINGKAKKKPVEEKTPPQEGNVYLTHEIILPTLKEKALDMRKANDARRVETILTEYAATAFESVEEAIALFIKLVDAHPETFNQENDVHKAVLREILETDYNFNFTDNEQKAEASNLKIELHGVPMNDLRDRLKAIFSEPAF